MSRFADQSSTYNTAGKPAEEQFLCSPPLCGKLNVTFMEILYFFKFGRYTDVPHHRVKNHKSTQLDLFGDDIHEFLCHPNLNVITKKVVCVYPGLFAVYVQVGQNTIK